MGFRLRNRQPRRTEIWQIPLHREGRIVSSAAPTPQGPGLSGSWSPTSTWPKGGWWPPSAHEEKSLILLQIPKSRGLRATP